MALGATAVVQAKLYLADPSYPSLGTWTAGLLAAAAGASMLVGLATPVASLLICLGGLGIAFSWLPAPASNLLDTWLVTLFVVIMAAAIAFLGPGAFSLDSRLFGRREIVIPQAPRSPKP